MNKFFLKEAFNQYLHSGCKTHTKRELLAYGGHNRPRINTCLDEWKAKGLVEVVKPWEEARDSDIVVKVLGFIEPEKN